MTDLPAGRRPPWQVWAVATTAALLHALPFLRTRLSAPRPGFAWTPAPYVPKDWYQYLALIREAPRSGELLLANPFTTAPQDGRYALLLHQVLGWCHRATGIDPAWLLELSRAALIAVFALVAWRFLEGFFSSERTRTWAVTLCLLAGGLDFAVTWASRWMPDAIGATVRQDLWPAYGWTTYQALFNPFWIAGLVLVLVGVRALLRPGGPGRRDVLVAGATLLVLWFTHVYSAIALVVIVGASLAGEWIAGGSVGRERLAKVAIAVAVPLAVAAAVLRWQLGDEVFRKTSGGVLGAQAAPVFWYPATLAVVGAFALRGWSGWISARHPWRYAIGGWVVGVALLHSSPVLNGYHFVPYLFLPVAIFAAEPVASAFDRLRAGGTRGAALGALLAIALFASTAACALRDWDQVAAAAIPADADALLESLARSAPGNVLCEASLGTLVPAYGPHRVYVGHWFLTPEYEARKRSVDRALSLQDAGGLRRIVATDRIDYVVAPSSLAGPVAEVLADRSPRLEPHGYLTLLRLAR